MKQPADVREFFTLDSSREPAAFDKDAQLIFRPSRFCSVAWLDASGEDGVFQRMSDYLEGRWFLVVGQEHTHLHVREVWRLNGGRIVFFVTASVGLAPQDRQPMIGIEVPAAMFEHYLAKAGFSQSIPEPVSTRRLSRDEKTEKVRQAIARAESRGKTFRSDSIGDIPEGTVRGLKPWKDYKRKHQMKAAAAASSSVELGLEMEATYILMAGLTGDQEIEYRKYPEQIKIIRINEFFDREREKNLRRKAKTQRKF